MKIGDNVFVVKYPGSNSYLYPGIIVAIIRKCLFIKYAIIKDEDGDYRMYPLNRVWKID